MRGRNRRSPNPLTRSYESNGPDVKIRGTAAHITEKYVQLARDSHASGDTVMAESYLQHAEHYYRLIAAAQTQFQPHQAQSFQPRVDEQDAGDDEGDEFENSVMDRYTFRPPQSYQPQQNQPYNGNGNGNGQQPYPHASQGYGSEAGESDQPMGDMPQPREMRGDREPRNDREPRQDREPRHDREPRQDREPRHDRDARGDREPRQDREPRVDRDMNGSERDPRGYGGRSPFGRRNRGPRPGRPQDDRMTERLADRPASGNGGAAQQVDAAAIEQPILPAFITAPVRVPILETPVDVPVATAAPEADAPARPRRRRRRTDEAVTPTPDASDVE
jgi:hypothetical protein